MAMRKNEGFDPVVIADYRSRIKTQRRSFVLDADDQNTDEYAHFFFVGKFHGNEVIYDTVMYSLRLQHESELFEEAEHQAARHFPNYKKITYEEDENGNLEMLDAEEEAIGLFMAEAIMELEEEETIKVREHADVDTHVDFGIALDVGLYVDRITPKVIDRFITDFNTGSLKLDPTLYSFQTEEAAS